MKKKEVFDNLEDYIDNRVDEIDSGKVGVEDDLFLINGEPKYTLKECLKDVPLTTFSLYDMAYNAVFKKENKLDDKEKYENYYYKLILKTIPKLDELARLKDLQHIHNIKGNISNEKCELLVNLGMEFVYMQDGKIVYVIPNEVLDKLNKIFTKEKFKDFCYRHALEYGQIYTFINGVIPKKVLKELVKYHYNILSNDEIDKIFQKSELREYEQYYTLFSDEQLKSYLSLPKLLKGKTEDINDYKLEEDAINEYKVFLNSLVLMYGPEASEYTNLIQLTNINNPNDLTAFVEAASKEFDDFMNGSINEKQSNLIKEELEKITNFLEENIYNFRFAHIFGRTVNEYNLKENLEYLIEKPEKTDLKSLLKLLKKDTLEEMEELMGVKSINALAKKILEDSSLNEYSFEVNFFLTENNNKNICEIINKIDFEDIKNGSIFIYRDNDEIKYVIPDELLESLNDPENLEENYFEDLYDLFASEY